MRENTFGTGASCTFRITDGVEVQATLRHTVAGWHIRDSGKGRGIPILVNADRTVDRILKPGDRVRIGPAQFELVGGDGPLLQAPLAAPAPAPAASAPPATGTGTTGALAKGAPADPGPGTTPDRAAPPAGSGTLLPRLCRIMGGGGSPLARLEAAVDALPECLAGVRRAIVWPVDPDKRMLEPAPRVSRMDRGEPGAQFHLPDFHQRVLESGRPHFMTGGRGSLTDLLAGAALAIGSAACLPLASGKEVRALLYLDSASELGAGMPGWQEELELAAPLFAQLHDATVTAAEIDGVHRRLDVYRKYFPLDLVDRMEARGRAVQTAGEMKKLTVMFTDIRGFTAMSEGLAPQDIIRFMNHYFESMVSAIQQYEGFVNKFIGDSIMAFWGAPEAKAIDSLLAVKAAVRMQKNLYHINRSREREGKAPFYMGVGIHTGPAVVGNVGSVDRKEYSALGDTVNTASRIESLTKLKDLPVSEEKYRIFLSESSWKEVSEQFKAEPMPPLEAKGKAAPLKLFSLVGVLSEVWSEEESLKTGYKVAAQVQGIRTRDEAAFGGRLLQLSREGAYISTDTAVSPGDELLVDLPFSRPGDREVPVRVTDEAGVDPGLVFVRFQSLSAALQRALEDYLSRQALSD